VFSLSLNVFIRQSTSLRSALGHIPGRAMSSDPVAMVAFAAEIVALHQRDDRAA